MVIVNRESYGLPDAIEHLFDQILLLFRKKCNVDERLLVEVSILEPEEIRELNRNYRGKDSVADVLSFPMDPGENENLLGAIYFCHREVQRKYEDVEFGMCYLFAHSLLHLIGYDHCEEMFRIQREIVDGVWGKMRG